MPNIKKTTEQFIKEAQEVHGNRYDYSESNYRNAREKINILCRIHGEFSVFPNSHLKGTNCKECTMVGFEEFKERSNKAHNNKFSYEKSVYINTATKLIVICPTHGDFYAIPHMHMNGGGCAKCAFPGLSIEEFIKRAKDTHGDFYNYSRTRCTKATEKVEIQCNLHGSFFQVAQTHWSGAGCPKCGKLAAIEKIKYTLEEFIEECKLFHKDRYDYSIVDYQGCDKRINVICRTHGVFSTLAGEHLRIGGNCRKCTMVTFEEFKERANKIHRDKFSYEKSIYINTNTKVNITCPKHGDFMQVPALHVRGHGCPKCNSSKGEQLIFNLLNQNSIDFKQQKTFEGLMSESGYFLRFDFYLPLSNTLIEYDGVQHFKPVPYWGGVEYLKKIQGADLLKNQYCLENNIPLIRIAYNEDIESKLRDYNIIS